MTERQVKILEWFKKAPGRTRFREEVEKGRRGDPNSYQGVVIHSLVRTGLLERFNKGKRTEFWRMTDDAVELLSALSRGN